MNAPVKLEPQSKGWVVRWKELCPSSLKLLVKERRFKGALPARKFYRKKSAAVNEELELLAEGIEQHLKHKQVSVRTSSLRSYKAVLKGWLDYYKEHIPANPAPAPAEYLVNMAMNFQRGRRACYYVVNGLYKALSSRYAGLGLDLVNPFEHGRAPKSDEPVRDILTPGQAEDLLTEIRTLEPKWIGFCAILLFAGLRVNEAAALKSRALRNGRLWLSGNITKTHMARNVEVTPNLSEWLDLADTVKGARHYWHPGGTLSEAATWARVRVNCAIQCGLIPWKKGAIRHSWASYTVAKTDNLEATAFQGGHTIDIMRRHYLNLVSPAEATEYFSIAP